MLDSLRAEMETRHLSDSSPLDILNEAINELNRCQAQQETMVKLIPDYYRRPAICLELHSAIESGIERTIELFSTPSMKSDSFDEEWSIWMHLLYPIPMRQAKIYLVELRVTSRKARSSSAAPT